MFCFEFKNTLISPKDSQDLKAGKMKDSMLKRLDRLDERINLRNSKIADSQFAVSKVLQQRDDERLAAYLASAHRAGLLDTEPSADDDSEFAQFVRVARRVLARTTISHRV